MLQFKNRPQRLLFQEGLALLILQDNRLPGYTEIDGTAHKVSLYADDTMVYLTSLNQWYILLEIYQLFVKAVGAALNEKKCEILVRGDMEESGDIGNAKIMTQSCYLGVPIGDVVDYGAFWSDMHINVKTVIKKWKRHYFFIRQRIAIAKQGLQSTLWYHMRCIPFRNSDIKPIQKTLFKYIWDNKEDSRVQGPIAIDQVCRPIEEGELGMIHGHLMADCLGMFWV